MDNILKLQSFFLTFVSAHFRKGPRANGHSIRIAVPDSDSLRLSVGAWLQKLGATDRSKMKPRCRVNGCANARAGHSLLCFKHRSRKRRHGLGRINNG